MAKIPPQAQKVFDGVIFDVYQWPQTMFDGTVETFEMIKRADTAVVIAVTDDRKLLLLKDEQPHRNPVVTFCSGRLELGENPLEAAKRELKEETGYESQNWEAWWSIQPWDKMDHSVHHFVARGVAKTGTQKLDAGERIEVMTLSIDDVLDQIISGQLYAYELGAHIMQQLLQGKRDELVSFLLGH